MNPDSPPRAADRKLGLGLRWLDAGEEANVPGPPPADWPELLARAESLPPPRRLHWGRWWPLLGMVNGVAALSGLLVWPHGSGVHLLVFLLTFWLLPLLLVAWSSVAALLLGRTPWWRGFITAHDDRVIALWCGRQSLLAQLLFAISGIGWMWLLLLTREVVFYWSTSIPAVSGIADWLFQWLGLGLLSAPPVEMIAAAKAGAISGWQSAPLADSARWAAWLTGVVGLWVVAPAAILLMLVRWRLRRALGNWPRFNRRLRARFEHSRGPTVSYRALQNENTHDQAAAGALPRLPRLPAEPGFGWQTGDALPAGSVTLGQSDYEKDAQTVRNRAREIPHWYIGAGAVPTGDLADLLRCQLDADGQPQLFILLQDLGPARVAALEQSWNAFIQSNRLPVDARLVTGAVES